MSEASQLSEVVQEVSFSDALKDCANRIRVGSKSFSAASRIFSPTERDAAHLLYGWCRYCDDAVDKAWAEKDRRVLRSVVQDLRVQTEKAYRGEPSDNPVFVAFSYVVRHYKIPPYYPLELLEGMAMDIDKHTYANFDELLQYCYRVASTVGLMMSHIMGVSENVALQHASDLGIAMQLTNIARDVQEDAAMGRVYLPKDWLAEEKLTPADVTRPEYREQVADVVARLLKRADFYYHSGDMGLKYLAFRPACAVAAAREVYAEIGRKVLALGPRAWDERVWVRPFSKILVMCRGVGRVFASTFRRNADRWKRIEISLVWRHA